MRKKIPIKKCLLERYLRSSNSFIYDPNIIELIRYTPLTFHFELRGFASRSNFNVFEYARDVEKRLKLRVISPLINY